MLGPARGRTGRRPIAPRWPEPATPPVPHPAPSPRWPLGSPEGCCPGLRMRRFSPARAPKHALACALAPGLRPPAEPLRDADRPLSPPLALGLDGPRRLRQPAHRD